MPGKTVLLLLRSGMNEVLLQRGLVGDGLMRVIIKVLTSLKKL